MRPNRDQVQDNPGYDPKHQRISMQADPRLFRRKYARTPGKRLTIGFYESASFLLLVFVIAGSLYPFDFDFSLSASRLEGFSDPPGRTDSLANLALFVPLGFCAGMLRTRLVQIFAVFCALFVAIGCQLVQIYLATRTPAAWDIVFNTIGLIIGLGLTRFVYHPLHRSETKLSLASFILIAGFLGYQLIPFAPSLDLSLLKISLARLLQTPALNLSSMLSGFAYVLIIAGALKTELTPKNANRILVGLVVSVLLLKPITATAHVSIAGLIGMLIALYPASKLPAKQWLFAGLACLALALYAYDGLTPFALRTDFDLPDFSPLTAIVEGSWLANLTALFWKSFLFIAAISLLFGALGSNTQVPIVSVISVSVIVEGAQVFLRSGTPSTLDIFLALALSAAFFRSVRTGSHFVDGYGRNHRLNTAHQNQHHRRA